MVDKEGSSGTVMGGEDGEESGMADWTDWSRWETRWAKRSLRSDDHVEECYGRPQPLQEGNASRGCHSSHMHT